MSFKVELHIANKVFKVLNYNTDYHQGTDQTNRPIVKPQGGIHNFTIEDDGSILIFDLMVKNNYTVDAVLIVFSRDGTSKSTTYILGESHCIAYRMTFNATSSEPAKEHFTLSPSYIKQNGVLMIAKYWKKIDLTNNAAPTRIYEEEEKDPKINSMVWLDDNDNKRIEVEEFNETIRVFIKVSDIDLGEMLTIKLYAKSNRNFESLKYKEYQAEVVEALGNIYATCKISLDKQWKINKPNVNNNLIDTIYIKATYNTVSKDFSTNGLDIVTQKLKGIYLEKGKDKAYYYQGKLYTATQDKKGMIPYTEKPRRQFRETKEALDLIYTKPIGKNFIDDIFKRSNPNFITITRKGGKNNTFGKKVSWSPGDNFGGLDVNGNTKRKPFIALAHELWHAWENWLQINNSSIWIQKTEMNRLEKSIRYKELTTSQFENKIRTEHSFPKRKWYSYTINDGNNTKTGFGQIF